MSQEQKQTEAQFIVLYGEYKTKWSKTTLAAYCHLFKGHRIIFAANENNVSEQTIYAFLKNNELKHLKQSEVLANAERYRDAALKASDQPEKKDWR